MKKVLKRITASLISGLMLFGSTYSVLGSISSASNEIQPRGIYHVYGDVNNDGLISLIDLVTINKTIQKFNDLTGSSELPLEFAIARPEVYYLTIPQAADVDGDNYITENDIIAMVSPIILEDVVNIFILTEKNKMLLNSFSGVFIIVFNCRNI